MRFLLAISLFLFSLCCHADIYKTVDANGNITYSDRPKSENSTVVSLPKANSAPATTPAPSSSKTVAPDVTIAPVGEDKDGRKAYTRFEIASPANEESIQNQPILNVSVDVVPALQEGDVVQIYVDGAPIGNAEHKTSFSFTIPYRGTHILSAMLFDKNMRVLMKSPSITIYVHQAFLRRPAS